MSDYFLAGFVDELIKTAKGPVPVGKAMSPAVKKLLLRLGVVGGGVGLAHRILQPSDGMGGAARAGIGIGGGMVAGSQLARAMGGKGGALSSAAGAYLGHRVMRKESSIVGEAFRQRNNAVLGARARRSRLGLAAGPAPEPYKPPAPPPATPVKLVAPPIAKRIALQ